MKAAELPVVAVYEYARTCPWISKSWKAWLNSTIPTCETVELDEPTVVPNDKKRVRVSTVFRDQYPSGIPVVPEEATAELLRSSLPSYLRQVRLDTLVFCTPSFPKRWSELPAGERVAARKLLARPNAVPVRDAKEQPEPLECQFKLAIDIDLATPQEIKRAFGIWLKKKLLEHKKQNPASSIFVKNFTPGRSAAPRFEVLRWLGAYRLKKAGLSYKDAIEEVERLQMETQDSTSGRFAKLPNVASEDVFSRDAGKARKLTELLETPSKAKFVPSGIFRL